jgi:hypothetical protein
MQPHQFTLYHFLHEYNQNRDLIEAYLKCESIEGFQAETDGKDKKDNDDPEISGFAIGVFLTFFVILLAFWIWALVATIKFWDFLPTWAKVLALIGLLTGIGGPLLTLIAVYVGKSPKKIK